MQESNLRHSSRAGIESEVRYGHLATRPVHGLPEGALICYKKHGVRSWVESVGCAIIRHLLAYKVTNLYLPYKKTLYNLCVIYWPSRRRKTGCKQELASFGERLTIWETKDENRLLMGLY